MQDSTMGFSELLAQARAGDEAAMSQIAERYEPQLRAVARVRLGESLRPYLDTMDLVQSVHRSLIVALHADRYDISSPDNLIGLAMVMVQRKVARQWRRLKRQQRDSVAEGDIRHVSQLLISLSSNENDPAAVVEFEDEVARVLSGMSTIDRQLIELRLQGESTAAAARRLGINANVLRVRLGRLRKRLRASGLMTDI